jgi:Tfp pilus assembly protein PilP
LILTLHPQGAVPAIAKNNPAPAPAPAKSSTPAAQAKTVAAKPAAVAVSKTAANAAAPPAPKIVVVSAPASKTAANASIPDSKQQAKVAPAKVAAAAKPSVPAAKTPVATPVKAEAAKPKPEEKKWAMSGKRDPFFSPVVQQNGSGCSTGKKCLEIGAINLRGVVKSDAGFIAVVTNNLNKAYFLRENDPVFNGYVVKITGDSVVFQETIQDKLGKPFTREIVKRIFTPAV